MSKSFRQFVNGVVDMAQASERSLNSSNGSSTPRKVRPQPSSGQSLRALHDQSLMGLTDRVPTVDHCWIAWCLDAGASGIIIPHVSRSPPYRIRLIGEIETVEQAKAALAATKFPNVRRHCTFTFRNYSPKLYTYRS